MAEEESGRKNVTGGTGGADGNNLYKPSCVVMGAPILVILALGVFAALGGLSLWIMIPLLLAVVGLAVLVYYTNKKKNNSAP